MRDALTNFGKVAITAAATETSKAVGSENIVNMTAPGRTEVTPQMCRIVFYPRTSLETNLSFEIRGADEVTGTGDAVTLKGPVETLHKYEVVKPKVGKTQKFSFPLNVAKKYFQVFGYGTGTAANVDVWFEFGA